MKIITQPTWLNMHYSISISKRPLRWLVFGSSKVYIIKGRVENRFYPALPHQTVLAVLPHTGISEGDRHLLMKELILFFSSVTDVHIVQTRLLIYSNQSPRAPQFCRSVSYYASQAPYHLKWQFRQLVCQCHQVVFLFSSDLRINPKQWRQIL